MAGQKTCRQRVYTEIPRPAGKDVTSRPFRETRNVLRVAIVAFELYFER